MMVNSQHVFNVNKGGYRYQVIDNEEGDVKQVHRYTVIKWDVKEKGDGGRWLAHDSSIYAQTKLEAVKAFIDKQKVNHDL